MNVSDVSGNTALHKAAKTGKIKNIKLLVGAGLDIDRRNNEGFTPLNLAVSSCDADDA